MRERDFFYGFMFHIYVICMLTFNSVSLDKVQKEPIGLIDSCHSPHFHILEDLHLPYLAYMSCAPALQNIPPPPLSPPFP